MTGELAEDEVTDEEFEEFMEALDDSQRDRTLSADFGELLLLLAIPTTTRFGLIWGWLCEDAFSLSSFISFSYFLSIRTVDGSRFEHVVCRIWYKASLRIRSVFELTMLWLWSLVLDSRFTVNVASLLLDDFSWLVIISFRTFYKNKINKLKNRNT